MKFEKTKVYNFDEALYGMRHPKESYNRSDTKCGIIIDNMGILKPFEPYKNEDGSITYYFNQNTVKNTCESLDDQNCYEYVTIGPKDLYLAYSLIKGGGCHRKFLRQIFVSVQITAPIYWWKEMDTYKVAVTRNSTSTMHKLKSTPITIDKFEMDDYWRGNNEINKYWENQILYLENLRTKFNETNDPKLWKELIRLLPESWLQKSTLTLSYETILAICSKDQRRNHKLTEWSESFMNWAKSLPFSKYLLFPDTLTERELEEYDLDELSKK